MHVLLQHEWVTFLVTAYHGDFHMRTAMIVLAASALASSAVSAQETWGIETTWEATGPDPCFGWDGVYASGLEVRGDLMVSSINTYGWDDDGNPPKLGSNGVGIFEQQGDGTWTSLQYLENENYDPMDFNSNGWNYLGLTNYIDGSDSFDFLAMGGGQWEGPVQIYERVNGGPFALVQEIPPRNGSYWDFGHEVKIDGRLMVVSDSGFSTNLFRGSSSYEGAAHIYRRNGSGVWNYVRSFVGNTDDRLGSEIAVRGNLVGVMSEGDSGNVDYCKVWRRINNATWDQVVNITENDLGLDYFHEMTIEGDALVIIGSESGNWDLEFLYIGIIDEDGNLGTMHLLEPNEPDRVYFRNFAIEGNEIWIARQFPMDDPLRDDRSGSIYDHWRIHESDPPEWLGSIEMDGGTPSWDFQVVDGRIISASGSRNWQEDDQNCMVSTWSRFGPEYSSGCEGDADGNGLVDVNDVLLVLEDFDTACTDCGSDLDGSGYVDVNDVLLLLSDWNCGS